MTRKRATALANIRIAQAVLAAIPRCGARTRAEDHHPCRNPGTGRGGRCRFHGGAIGSGRPDTGKGYSKVAKRAAEQVSFWLWVANGGRGGRWKRFRATPERVEQMVSAAIEEQEAEAVRTKKHRA